MQHSHYSSQSQKNANNFAYYRYWMDNYEQLSYGQGISDRFRSGKHNKKVANYGIMSGVVEPTEYSRVTAPSGIRGGERALNIPHRDILTHRIYAVLNMERKRPFQWYVSSVNPSATTQKEQEKIGQVKSMFADYLKQYITAENEVKSDDFINQVRKYLARRNLQPIEMMGQQILNYLEQEQDLQAKYLSGLRHLIAGGEEIYYTTEVGGKPFQEVVSDLWIDYDPPSTSEFIEDSEWIVRELRLLPHEVIKRLEGDLTPTEQQEIYDMYDSRDNAHITPQYTRVKEIGAVYDRLRVIHAVWRGKRKLLKLTAPELDEPIYMDESYEPQAGEEVETVWVEQIEECYKIGSDKYKRCRPVENQHLDIEGIHRQPLPYSGIASRYDNGEIRSLVDVGFNYQLLYNIYSAKKDKAIAADKGVKVFLPIGIIPRDEGLTLSQYENKINEGSIHYVNLAQPGSKLSTTNLGELIHRVDMSNPTDISTYIKLCEWYDMQCERRLGIPPQLEGQIAERESVRNVNAILSGGGNVLGYYFQKHDLAKRNALRNLLNQAIVCYRKNPSITPYILDDQTMAVLNSDLSTKAFWSLGVFVQDSTDILEAQAALTEQALAAVNSQLLPLSATVQITTAKSPLELEEILLEAESRQEEVLRARRDHELQVAQAIEKAKQDTIRLKSQLDKERELEVQRQKSKADLIEQTVLALGFADDTDVNNNKVPDVVDILKTMVEEKRLQIMEKQLKEKPKSDNNN